MWCEIEGSWMLASHNDVEGAQDAHESGGARARNTVRVSGTKAPQAGGPYSDEDIAQRSTTRVNSNSYHATARSLSATTLANDAFCVNTEVSILSIIYIY